MKQYSFNVSFGEGKYAKGTYEVIADNVDEAQDKALSSICEKLADALPTLDIEVTVVPVEEE